MGPPIYDVVWSMRVRLIASVAAGLIAVLFVGVFFFANRLNHPQSNAPPRVESSTRLGVGSLASSCGSSSFNANNSTVPPAVITGLSIRWDDVAVSFMDGGPRGRIDIRPQTGTNFTLAPSGTTITLGGRNGILVTIRSADLHSAYSDNQVLRTDAGHPAAPVRQLHAPPQSRLGRYGQQRSD